MTYVILKVLTLDDEELGYVVHKQGTEKLEDSNLWLEGQGIEDHVAALNERVVLAEHWPDARDPEVEELVLNREWEPIEMTTLDNPIYDDEGNQIGTEEIEVPLDPRHPMERFQKACEIIARERAGL